MMCRGNTEQRWKKEGMQQEMDYSLTGTGSGKGPKLRASPLDLLPGNLKNVLQ